MSLLQNSSFKLIVIDEQNKLYDGSFSIIYLEMIASINLLEERWILMKIISRIGKACLILSKC